jgi:hypothetical protein
VLVELLDRHLVALGQALHDAVDFIVARLDADPLGLLQLQAVLDQLLLGLFPEARDEGGTRAVDCLLLQREGELLLALLEDGADLLARLALVLLDRVLEDGAQLGVGALRRRHALEVLF